MRCEYLKNGGWYPIDGVTFYATCSELAKVDDRNDAGAKVKYRLTKKVRFEAPGHVQLPGGKTSRAKRLSTPPPNGVSSWLELEPGYLWDGPSKGPDSSTTCVAALCHDAMYTLLRQRRLRPWRRFRKTADSWHRDLLRLFCAGECFAGVCYLLIRLCGWWAARPRNA